MNSYITRLSVTLLGSLAGFFVLFAFPAFAANLKITPLGSHDGEFCSRDRALVLEDPNGTRLLYDAGLTVAGPEDKRLGKIDVVLVSHMHGDHVGAAHIPKVNSGECGKPKASVKALPNSNSINIVLAKKARIVTGSEMHRFFAQKLKQLGGNPRDSLVVRFGASLKVGGVTITTVPAVHSNGVIGGLIGGELGKMMDAAGIAGYVGPPTGYVLTFSNGLVVYLSGDTGITAEQDTVVRQHYDARLAVMNIGDTYTNGPREAAFVVNELIKPNSVIASHANEAATMGGKLIPGTRTELFIKESKVPVHVPLSGRTMEFDKDGKCVRGC